MQGVREAVVRHRHALGLALAVLTAGVLAGCTEDTAASTQEEAYREEMTRLMDEGDRIFDRADEAMTDNKEGRASSEETADRLEQARSDMFDVWQEAMDQSVPCEDYEDYDHWARTLLSRGHDAIAHYRDYYRSGDSSDRHEAREDNQRAQDAGDKAVAALPNPGACA